MCVEAARVDGKIQYASLDTGQEDTHRWSVRCLAVSTYTVRVYIDRQVAHVNSVQQRIGAVWQRCCPRVPEIVRLSGRGNESEPLVRRPDLLEELPVGALSKGDGFPLSQHGPAVTTVPRAC